MELYSTTITTAAVTTTKTTTTIGMLTEEKRGQGYSRLSSSLYSNLSDLVTLTGLTTLQCQGGPSEGHAA